MSIASRMRRMTIRRPTTVESATGAQTVTMVRHCDVTASAAPLSQRAIAALGVKHTETTHVVTIRARLLGITSKHDILDGATVYAITGVTELPHTTVVYAMVIS